MDPVPSGCPLRRRPLGLLEHHKLLFEIGCYLDRERESTDVQKRFHLAPTKFLA